MSHYGLAAFVQAAACYIFKKHQEKLDTLRNTLAYKAIVSFRDEIKHLCTQEHYIAVIFIYRSNKLYVTLYFTFQIGEIFF